MVRLILNEGRNKSQSGDVTSYDSLMDVSHFIEPVDVTNGEYTLFDTDGFFYGIKLTDKLSVAQRFEYVKCGKRLSDADYIVNEFLQRCGISFDPTATLESGSLLLTRYE